MLLMTSLLSGHGLLRLIRPTNKERFQNFLIMDIQDEKMHPVKDEPAWSESYYFNFVDPDSKLGMFTRMGFRPGDGWADGLHVVDVTARR